MKFFKYHGTGNDFVMIDAETEPVHILTTSEIKSICHRHYGVGADGLIIVSRVEEQLHMKYFNSDGREGSFCGNGGRCFVQFALDRKYISPDMKISFTAYDGEHNAEIATSGEVVLHMKDVDEVQKLSESEWELNTGSPHLLILSEAVSNLDVNKLGAEIRYSEKYSRDGINVNFLNPSTAELRTYERGVEAETMSCGTGTVAAAISLHEKTSGDLGAFSYELKSLGGKLRVSGTKERDGVFTQLRLQGPATFVFTGEWMI